VLANPFGTRLASVINSPVLLTARRKWFRKGTGSTSIDAGALGFGFVGVRPFNMAVNDASAIAVSTSLYTAAVVNDTNAGPVIGVQIFNPNSEFASAAVLTSDTSYRLVACGLRVRPNGAMQNVQGSVCGVTEPSHQSLGNYTYDDVNGYAESASETLPALYNSVTAGADGWFTTNYSPSTSGDLDFKKAFPIAGQADSMFMAFAFNGGATVAQPFEWEAHAIVEYQGSAVGGRVVSMDDPVGHSSVAAILKSAPALQKPHRQDPHKLGNAAGDAANHYAKKHISGSGHNVTHHADDNGKDTSDWTGVLTGALGLAGGILSFL